MMTGEKVEAPNMRYTIVKGVGVLVWYIFADGRVYTQFFAY